jgi:thioredoxin
MATAMNLTQANLEETLNKNEIVVLDFWASWCGPCRMFAPIFEKVAARNPGIVFGKINTEEEQALASAFQIRSIPTLMVFRQGIIVFMQSGMLPESAMDELLAKVKSLDMNEVRRQIDAAETTA